MPILSAILAITAIMSGVFVFITYKQNVSFFLSNPDFLTTDDVIADVVQVLPNFKYFKQATMRIYIPSLIKKK